MAWSLLHLSVLLAFQVRVRGFSLIVPHLHATKRVGREVSCQAVEISNIADIPVTDLDGTSLSLGQLLPEDSEDTIVLSCLSHYGDFNAWELTQQYVTAIESGKLDARVVLVGVGSVDSARQFASDLDLGAVEGSLQLVTDETGAVSEALGCYKGWLAIDKAHAEQWPATDVNPYIKLFGMIFGLGSPGTIGRVLYGYVGDKDGGVTSRKWVVDSLLSGSQQGRWPKLTEDAFDGVPADSGLRPFELATLRAQTGIHIVLNWGKLGPNDGDLFTRMGGSFVFRGGTCVWEYFDKGILTYASMNQICDVVS